MGFLSGLINNEGDKKDSKKKEYDTRPDDFDRINSVKYIRDQNGTRMTLTEYKRQEAQMDEILETSVRFYKKASNHFRLIDFTENEIEGKVVSGILTYADVDRMNFYLSKINRVVLFDNHSDNWETLRENIEIYEEIAFKLAANISRYKGKA